MSNLIQLDELEGFKILEVKQYENNERDRPEFDSKYLKIWYFITNEGFLSTLRKYLAHKIKQQRFLTFLFIEANQKRYVNISIQYQSNPNEFVVKNEFFLNCTNIDFTEISHDFNRLIGDFNQFDEGTSYEQLNIDRSHSITLNVKEQEFPEIPGQGLFIYGLGGYVRMFIMHHFKKVNKLACIDYKTIIAKDFKQKYGFRYSFLTPASSFALVEKVQAPIVIIATYHSDHASLAYDVFKLNPKSTIFIEKPPAVTLEDLGKLIRLFNKKANIEIGFNRRFINFSRYVKEKVADRKILVTCTIKEVVINDNHWYLWKNQGTRITGNVVHWFDLANWWIQSKPLEINVIADPKDHETSCISVLYENGSILNITASDSGNSMRGVQEKIEVRFDNQTVFIDDFTKMTHILKNGVKVTRTKFKRDKGHNAMYNNFRQIISGTKSSDYTVAELINTSVVTFYASQMVLENVRNMNIEQTINKYMDQVT